MTIRVADLPIPSGVTIEIDPEAPVAVAQPPRAREEAEGEAVEGESAVAGETAGAAADGDAEES